MALTGTEVKVLTGRGVKVLTGREVKVLTGAEVKVLTGNEVKELTVGMHVLGVEVAAAGRRHVQVSGTHTHARTHTSGDRGRGG